MDNNRKYRLNDLVYFLKDGTPVRGRVVGIVDEITYEVEYHSAGGLKRDKFNADLLI